MQAKDNLIIEKQSIADNTLAELVQVARDAFGEHLVSALVFGSAANGQLRATSDVNLMLVLTSFTQVEADKIRDAVRLARAVVDMHVMFITLAELPVATKAFTLKFADIAVRHKILFGVDPFEKIHISNEDLVVHTKQALLNFQLRTREQYVLMSLREEQLVKVIADSAAPLRSCASALRHIRGEPHLPAKEALENFARQQSKPEYLKAVEAISNARETMHLAAGQAEKIVMDLLDLSHALYLQLP